MVSFRYINPVEIHPKRITQTDKEFVNDLDYAGIGFPVDKAGFSRIQTNNNISINVYCYENKLTFPIYISDQEFENSMELLLLTDENKSHQVYNKDFDRFMFQKAKNTFAKVVYNALVAKMF